MSTSKEFISIESQIDKSIHDFKKGKIFFPSSFSKFGSSSAIRKALSRLEDKGILIRISHGVYLYPKRHKTLGILQPTIEEIAIAISKRDKARIIPTGIQAMNKLGLTTQVPLNAVYLTDGSPRTLRIGKRSIKFKKASPKILAVKSELLLMVFLAMSEMGHKNINTEVTRKIQKLISEVDKQIFLHDIKLAPQWVASHIKKLNDEQLV